MEVNSQTVTLDLVKTRVRRKGKNSQLNYSIFTKNRARQLVIGLRKRARAFTDSKLRSWHSESMPVMKHHKMI